MVDAVMHPLVEALVLLFPSLAPWVREHPEIPAAIVEAADAHQVPTALLLAVCLTESRLGADPHTQLTCGVYRVPRARQADAAAHALARWRARCRSWPRALRMFRGGQCASPDPHGYVRRVSALAVQIERRAASANHHARPERTPAHAQRRTRRAR
jgi:hypothetical protein